MDITVARNHASETASQASFQELQSSIYETYGRLSPSAPVLRCRNATQTSVVLEWDPIQLATADIRSLSLYRNGAKAGAIPRPLEQTSTKLSGLAIDQDYVFHLVLRTSAGTYSSEKLTVRTHKMTDLSGITITPGRLPEQLKSSLAAAVERIGAKLIDTVRIDTTHFVCSEGGGREWERAVESNIPVVRHEWVDGCEREGRIVGVRGYYLNADPRLRQVGQGVAVGGQQPQRTDNQSSAAKRPDAPSPGNDGAAQSEQARSVEAPAPPEKDPGHESRPGPSRSATLNSVKDADASPPSAKEAPYLGRGSEEALDEDEDGAGEEEEQEDHKESKHAGAGVWAEEAGHSKQNLDLPHRGIDYNEDDSGSNNGNDNGKEKGLEASDNGSFSEVAL